MQTPDAIGAAELFVEHDDQRDHLRAELRRVSMLHARELIVPPAFLATTAN